MNKVHKIAQKLIKQLPKNRDLVVLYYNWDIICPNYHQFCYPSYITIDGPNKILTVSTKPHYLMTINREKQILNQIINKFIGKKYVLRLKPKLYIGK